MEAPIAVGWLTFKELLLSKGWWPCAKVEVLDTLAPAAAAGTVAFKEPSFFKGWLPFVELEVMVAPAAEGWSTFVEPLMARGLWSLVEPLVKAELLGGK